MCFSSGPKAPINKPNYAVNDAWKYTDVSMTDSSGNVTDIDGVKKSEHLKATGYQDATDN